MQSSKKRKGTEEEIGSVCSMDANRLDTAGSRDAISCLPQEILGEILSLVPIKLAVSTSVLSKKWRNVFALVHNLDFDDSVLLQPEEYKDEWDVIRESFRNFVDRTLALECASPIKKFSLKYHIEDGRDMVSVCRWICNAVERCVLEADLSLTDCDKPLTHRVNGVKKPAVEFEVHGILVSLPCQLLTSKTLVKLSLGTKLEVDMLPRDVSLPALKSLFIDSIVFEDQDLCDVLLHGCPVLEELTVRHEYDWYPYRIASQTIKKLTVYYDWEDGLDNFPQMSFDAPSLVSLDYTDYAMSSYPHVNLESLVEAKLDLCYSEKFERPDISGLIVGISNVESLDLSLDSVDVMSGCVENGLLMLPVFNNLVKLSFGSCKERGWKLLPYLLKQCPKVETLIIQGLHGYTGDVTIGLYQVKVLDVRGYKGTAKELEHLKSLLGGAAECLEKVRVEFHEDVVVDAGNTHKDLVTFLAASKWDTQYAYFN